MINISFLIGLALTPVVIAIGCLAWAGLVRVAEWIDKVCDREPKLLPTMFVICAMAEVVAIVIVAIR